MKYNRSYFELIAEELSRVVTHPVFIQKMDELRRAPDSDRVSMAAAVSPDNLRKQGLLIPETFRVSPRTFEDPTFASNNGVQNPGLEPGSSAASSWESFGSMPQDAFDGSTWGAGSDALPDKPENPEVIRKTVYQAVLAIADAVLAPAFYQALTEIYDLPFEQRPRFVLNVFLNEEERKRRGIVLPETMRIQRSTFYDGRPTLFCVSKKENLAYPWRKITVTFDSEEQQEMPNLHGSIESTARTTY